MQERAKEGVIMLSLATCAAALLMSLPQDDCDHQRARTKEGKVEVVSYVNCKTGATMITPVVPFLGGGDRGGPGDAFCPLLVIVTPAHGVPEPAAYWNLTGPALLEQTRYRFECMRDWFLFFPISQPYCKHAATETAGRIESFGSERCPTKNVDNALPVD
jgi:hypothetical protein